MTPRLIKEVSVAGESPDMSEQRKSSGTAEGRDPRLAVFREPDAGAGADAAGGTAGTATDSETAVFRMPGAPDAPESAAAPEGRAEGAEGPEEGPEGASTPPEPEEAAEEATTAPEAPAGPAGPTSGSAEAETGAGSASEAGTEAEADSGAEVVPETGSSRDDGRTGAGSDGDERPEPEVEPEPEAVATDAEAATGPGAEPASGARSQDAPVAAPVAAPAPAPAEEAGAGSGTRADSGADSGSDAEPDERPAAAPGSSSVSESESDEGQTPADARLRAVVAAWVATDPEEETAAQSSAAEGRDASSEGDEDTGSSSGDASAVTGDKPADTGVAPSADADGKPGADDDATAAGDAGTPSGNDAAVRTDSDDDASADAGDDASVDADDVPAAGASTEAPRVPKTREEVSPAKEPELARDGRGIDHPTAVFKAPRAEQLDHPTTALKLPPKEKEAPRKPASWAAKPSGTPEAPAERTSKFVPLRSDDVRPPAVVGPTITPDVAAGPGTPASPGAGLPEAERTRQQPMPPRPPLDLLAELTNTPPPEETPVRTAVRRVKIWTPLVLLLLIIFAIAQSVRPLPEPTLTLSAEPTYTFGGEKLDMPWPEEGQGAVEVEGVGTIGTYGKEKSAPIASVAKIMTAYVILQGHPITGKEDGDRIEVDAKAGEEADRPDESTAPIKEGQKYTERQMLQLLMIPSGNNVARLLARWDATTEKAFVEKMNAAAKDLGMTNSVYTDPSGLESTTRSTPADQLKLAKAVMQNDVFREIVNMPQAQIPGIDKMIYNNNNILLEPGVSGIKTGSSTPAGGNLIWTADTIIDGKSRRIIGAVMGADAGGTLDAKLQRSLQTSLALIRAAQKGVDSATVVKKGQVVGYVDNGLGTRTPVVATKDLKAVGWGGLEVELELADGGKTPAQVAKAGTVVGEVTVGSGTGKVSAPVAIRSEMTEPAFGDKLTRIT
ncbi:D-alanyl-D-alanine carboxypeptidase [Streptomyces mutomycini]